MNMRGEIANRANMIRLVKARDVRKSEGYEVLQIENIHNGIYTRRIVAPCYVDKKLSNNENTVIKRITIRNPRVIHKLKTSKEGILLEMNSIVGIVPT